jgi:hypothetical protein
VVVYGRGNGALGSPSIVAAVVNALSETGLDFSDLRTESPDLEDVFLTLTGRPLGQEKELLK